MVSYGFHGGVVYIEGLCGAHVTRRHDGFNDLYLGIWDVVSFFSLSKISHSLGRGIWSGLTDKISVNIPQIWVCVALN